MGTRVGCLPGANRRGLAKMTPTRLGYIFHATLWLLVLAIILALGTLAGAAEHRSSASRHHYEIIWSTMVVAQTSLPPAVICNGFPCTVTVTTPSPTPSATPTATPTPSPSPTPTPSPSPTPVSCIIITTPLNGATV